MTGPQPLWTPSAQAHGTTELGRFWTSIEAVSGRRFGTYDDLWEWSVGEGLEAFWAHVWRHFDVKVRQAPSGVLVQRTMPGAVWFPGARLNYVDQVLRWVGERPDAEAVIGVGDTRPRMSLTWAELAAEVRRVAAGLRALGVGPGDRVAGLVPTIPESVVAFLATASLGAIWTSCAPEFGPSAVLDRFGQVEPTVLIAVSGYRYGTREVDRSRELREVQRGLTSLRHTVLVPYGQRRDADDSGWVDVVRWDDLGVTEHLGGGGTAELSITDVAFDHPLYILYSSGTTGLPKAIVHGHGGMLLVHLKALGLHADLGPRDRFLWYTTTGWMMWNYLVSGLLRGASIVLFDGDPSPPERLWEVASAQEVTWLGLGAPMLGAAQRAGLQPARHHDLSRLRAVGATGSPLAPAAFRWVYDHVSPEVMLSPISGGTDICSAFVGGSPLSPVWEGEIPCRYLGAAVRAFDPDGRSVVGTEGELVVTEPMPSMPVGFWADTEGHRYRQAYFEHYPGVWRHGDWITITEHGGCVISGRSDATLNRGGVRVGTAEIYRVVEDVPGVVDSLVVHVDDGDGTGHLVLFVVVDDEHQAHLPTAWEPLRAAIAAAVRTSLSPRHVPDEFFAVPRIPTTLTGKKLEVPVKRILQGAAPDSVASRESLRDPEALDAIVAIARERLEAPPS